MTAQIQSSGVYVFFLGLPVGQVRYFGKGTSFVYAPEFVQTQIELSPLRMPLAYEPYLRADAQFNNLPGILADSLPDTYGTRLMKAYFKSRGLSAPGPLESLAYVGDNGLGALTFKPELNAGGAKMNDAIELFKLIEAHRMQQEDGRFNLRELVRKSGTAGGAQPKALLSHDRLANTLFISNAPERESVLVKFQTDPDDEEPRVEHSLMQLAAQCGVSAAETYLFTTPSPLGNLTHLAVKRFDLNRQLQRYHLASLAGLTEGQYPEGYADYAGFIKVTGAVTRDYTQKLEVFRRAMFNVLVNNHDDHDKNHAFLSNGREWWLSPAYDITYAEWSETAGRAMRVCGHDNHITRADFQRLADEGELQSGDVSAVFEQMNSGISKWTDVATVSGVSDVTIQRVADTIQRNATLVFSKSR
ncbi:MAG: type II toxin-antitoxin system HipA family toxin [Verrucomicrobiales bacterium]|jgi:serine/threonine-protein kinase HipA|nr:type II toxin-antitoxin system HipA family toxin [Verrucomicrobiales bacterium]